MGDISIKMYDKFGLKEAFCEWSKQAQEMRDRALAGEVTMVEFERWLKD